MAAKGRKEGLPVQYSKLTKAVSAAARVTALASLSVAMTPLLSTSLSESGRPAYVEEANAALLKEGAALEARQLWENRPRGEMAERGARVFVASAQAAAGATQAGFHAGRLGSRGSLLKAGLMDGDDLMRTALAGPQDLSERMSIAASLRPSTAPAMNRADEVMTASLQPEAGPVSIASDALEMAYAPSRGPAVSSRFDDLLKDRDQSFVPPIGEKDHSWAATPLPASVFSKKEQTCLATGLYFEARGEVAEGQEAVAQVILNRVRAPSYPDTICGVVYQNQHMRNRCQFSFACDGIPDRVTSKRAYAKAEEIALAVTKGDIWIPEVGSATHYHATYVRPRWASAMERVDKIGLHIFYRTFGGGWN